MSPADWIGYLEHQTQDQLWHYTANPGKGGYTIFAQIIANRQRRNLQGLPWCATFVHAVIDRPDVLGKAHPGTRVLARRMRRKKLWRPQQEYSPKPGDLIFFKCTKERIDHVGIVESAEQSSVTVIAGNTIDPSGHFKPDQGGAVARMTYSKTDPRIAGYAAITETTRKEVPE